MSKGPGKIIKWMDDQRTFIVYDKQPLLKNKGMVILNVVQADDYKPVIGKVSGKEAIVLQRLEVYNQRVNLGKVIGYVD